VSESAVTDAGEHDPRHEKSEGKSPFARIGLFVRQVVSELRRVVTPSREDVIRYTWIVLTFVGVIMLIVFALDYGFRTLAKLAFNG
jgi:preprotein translocase subunit SecE